MRSHGPQQAAALRREIERIKTLDLDGLALQWRNSLGKRVPEALPKALLLKMIIYQLQSDALGDLEPNAARIVEGYAGREAGNTAALEGVAPEERAPDGKQPGPRASAPLNIKSGSVLVREWGGRTNRVMALEIGFAWEGRSYRSLSEVARAITGTRWNGRRFFGVGRQPEGARRASAEQDGSKPSSRAALAFAEAKP